MSNLQDDVRKFILEIEESKNNGETLAQLTKLQKETAKYRQENEELQKVMAHLDAKGQRNSKTYKEMEAKLKANKKAIQQNGVAMKGLEKNLDTNYMSMGQLKKRAMELRSALNTTSKAANPQEYNRLETELKQVGKQMDVLKGKSNQTQGFLGKMKGAAAGIMPALGPAALVAGAGAAAKKIFDLSKQTMDYRQQMQKLTGESGQQLADLTAQVEASSKTFQKDFNEMAVANHNFAESMGLTEAASQSLIDKGFLAGADASGEFLDRLREYGPQFKAAGISAEQAIAIMTQETKSGIYSDKGTDAIKEATIAIREMTPVTRQAIDGIGLSSQKLEADLRSGSISYFDAIQMISNKMAELPPQSTEVGAALADIFKGAGEDAGLDYITMLGTVETSMDKMVEGAGETAQAQQKLLDANNKLSKAWSDMLGTGTGTFTALKAGAKSLLADGLIGIMKGIAGIRDWFIELYNESAVVRGYLQYFFAGWKTAIAIVKNGLIGLWDLLKAGGKLIKGVLTFDAGDIKEAISDWGNALKKNVKNNAKDIGNAWATAYNETVNGRIAPVKQVVEIETVTTNKTSNNSQSNSGGNAKSTDNYQTEEEDSLGVESWMTDGKWDKYGAEELAARKASEEEWTAFLQQQIDERTAAEAEALDIEKEIAEARIELKDIQVQAIRQLASSLAGMFEQGSAAQIAMIAIEKAIAIAQIWMNLGKEKSAINLAAANIAAQPWPGARVAAAAYQASMTAKAVAAAKINTGLIAAQTVASAAASSGKSEKSKKMYDGGFAGYTGNGGKYDKKQLVQLHGSEYVVPKEGTSNPEVKRIIDIIEIARRNGTLRSLNPLSVLGNTNNSVIKSRSDGGYIDTGKLTTIGALISGKATDIAQNKVLKELAEAVNSLKGWQPTISYNKFEKLEQEYKRQQEGSQM